MHNKLITDAVVLGRQSVKLLQKAFINTDRNQFFFLFLRFKRLCTASLPGLCADMMQFSAVMTDIMRFYAFLKSGSACHNLSGHAVPAFSHDLKALFVSHKTFAADL